MRKIKILFVHHGGATGGSPRSLLFLLNELDKERYDVYVLVTYDYYQLKEMYEPIGAKVVYEPNYGAWHGSTVGKMSPGMLYANLKLALPTYKTAKKVLKEIQPDIIHLNSTCMFIFAKAAKKWNEDVPIVCHVREPLLPNIWGNILKNGCHKYVNAFIAIEQYDLDSVNIEGKIAKIVYNFVDFNIYNTSAKSRVLRDELHLDAEDIIALYLARISPENGVLELIYSCKNLLETNRQIHLCLVGAKEEHSEYQEEVERAVKNMSNIHILPFRKDVVEVIASSDFMVSPFKQPHFSRSVIEAAALGIPSIGSNVGGLKELIIDGKTGLLFDYGDFSDCEKKFRMMAFDINFRLECGKNAEVFAKQNFDAKKNAQAIFEIYDLLLYNGISI